MAVPFDGEGFVHNGRRVFALRYRLECPPPQILELIVPLAPDGNALPPCDTLPVEPSKRIVNVHPGDKILHSGKEYTVQAIDVFRSLRID